MRSFICSWRVLAVLHEFFNPCVSGNATFGVHFPEESNLLYVFGMMFNGMGIAYFLEITSDTCVEISVLSAEVTHRAVQEDAISK